VLTEDDTIWADDAVDMAGRDLVGNERIHEPYAARQAPTWCSQDPRSIP
jgi:hypothetical protein